MSAILLSCVSIYLLINRKLIQKINFEPNIQNSLFNTVIRPILLLQIFIIRNQNKEPCANMQVIRAIYLFSC